MSESERKNNCLRVFLNAASVSKPPHHSPQNMHSVSSRLHFEEKQKKRHEIKKNNKKKRHLKATTMKGNERWGRRPK